MNIVVKLKRAIEMLPTVLLLYRNFQYQTFFFWCFLRETCSGFDAESINQQIQRGMVDQCKAEFRPGIGFYEVIADAGWVLITI